MTERLTLRRQTDPSRVFGFTDGFFAIVITLLVIEIHRPEAKPGELGRALVHAWPSYAAFGLAFLYVGVIWLNHHGLFRLVKKVDRGLNWINLGILGTAALMPFPTGVLASAYETGDLTDRQAAVTLYGIVAGLMSLAWVPVFPYLERHRATLAPEVPAGYFRAQQGRPWFGVAIYAVAIAAGWLIGPNFALGLFVLMLLFHAFTSEGVIPDLDAPAEMSTPDGEAPCIVPNNQVHGPTPTTPST